MTITRLDVVENHRRAKALPIYARGEIPSDKNLSVEDDSSGFLDVVRLFLRSWPYIRPQLLGRWFVPKKGLEPTVADPVIAPGYSYWYAPVVYALIFLTFHLYDWMPWEANYAWLLLDAFALITGACFIATGNVRGGWLFAFVVAMILSIIMMVAMSFYVIDGLVDGLYTVLLIATCLVGWSFQIRFVDGRIDYKVRIGTHLVYFYAIQFLQRFVGIGFGLVNADLLNQAILQGEPLAPGLSEFLGYNELNVNNIANLTEAQRYDIWYFWIGLTLGFHMFNFPLNIFNGWYNMWIQQRINQDLRVALVRRWHLLSMSYHSEHRTGDSIFRIYQDSSQVTVVIGHIINLIISVGSYFSCVGLVSLLEPWLGVAALVLTVPGILLSAYAMPRVRVRSLVYRASSSDVTSTVQESFSSIRLIKAFTNNNKAQQKLEEDSVGCFQCSVSSTRTDSVGNDFDVHRGRDVHDYR